MIRDETIPDIQDNNLSEISKITDHLVFLEFVTDWSGSSVMLTSILQKLNQKYTGVIKVFHVDVENNPIVSEHYKIEKIPSTIILFKGVVVEKIEGIISLFDLDKRVCDLSQQFLNKKIYEA